MQYLFDETETAQTKACLDVAVTVLNGDFW